MEFFGEETSTSKQKATPNNLKYGACKPCKLKHLKCKLRICHEKIPVTTKENCWVKFDFNR